MNWAAGICCHCREKNAFSRSRFAACRGAKTASGQSRQTHGLAGQGLPFGPCSPDSGSAQAAVNTSRVPPSELGDARCRPGRARRPAAGSRAARSAASASVRTTGGWARRIRSCWASSMIASTHVLLRRGGGGQVVVALDRRAVVGVDRRPGAAVPARSGPAGTGAWSGSGAGGPQRPAVAQSVVARAARDPPGRCQRVSAAGWLSAATGRRARPGRRVARAAARSAPATAPAAGPPGAAGSGSPPRCGP